MNKNVAFVSVMVLAIIGFALADITPTTFLQIGEPDRMHQQYVNDIFGDSVTLFFTPSGGAFIRMRKDNDNYCISIFCDRATNELTLFHFFETGNGRVPIKMSYYGKQPPWNPWADTIIFPDSVNPPAEYIVRRPGGDSAEYFYQPIDVAVSSNGRYFKPDSDFVYVLDQGNRRVVKLRFDTDKDSLMWVSSFGSDTLLFPTAIDYMGYGTPSYADDDILVTDGRLCKVLRYSASGEYETWYGGYGNGLPDIGYPTGVAVSADSEFANFFYISDSRNRRISYYYSDPYADIIYMGRCFVPAEPAPYLSALDTDKDGNVYIIDLFNEKLWVFTPTLDKLQAEYGIHGTNPGEFNVPSDIYIDIQEDQDEMVICESWDTYSGIQSFVLDRKFGKRSPGETQLPARFALYSNYPNPFNTTTTIAFDLPKPTNVVIDIYNILGQRVTRLVERPFPAGRHQARWNASSASSGIYFVRINTGSDIAVKKMLLLK
jgi:sugar lactone lactonase YvrE